MKKGRFAKAEMDFMMANASSMSNKALALKMDRDPVSVEAWVKKRVRVQVTEEESAIFDLKDRPYWKEICLQFSKSELELFVYHWSRIVSQFRDDVTSTEEMQVVDLIKLELLMNRSLKMNRSGMEQIESLERLILIERGRELQDQDRDMILVTERQVSSLRGSQESMNRDYRDMQVKKNGMLKEMRATREQRVKKLEDSKENFKDWIVHLMKNPAVTKGYGEDMEKMKLAMEAEKERLTQPHEFTDGVIDQPFLTPETAMAKYGK